MKAYYGNSHVFSRRQQTLYAVGEINSHCLYHTGSNYCSGKCRGTSVTGTASLLSLLHADMTLGCALLFPRHKLLTPEEASQPRPKVRKIREVHQRQSLRSSHGGDLDFDETIHF